MTLADENHNSPLMPSRRRVVQAAAWSIPAISVAAASPAFATTPVTPAELITFTSGMFWRPNADEITDPDEAGLWGFLPAGSIIWITQITNLGAAPQSVSLELGAPPVGSGFLAAKGFRVLDAGGLAVTPEVSVLSSNGTRSADGRVVVNLPQVPVTTPATVTVLIDRPESVTRGSSPSWNVTVTPPGAGNTISVPITSYADFLASVA
ncbi:hypothetical protein [Nocardioides gilvus]|uniref:hypothetical protein n=1 Tax=Nocardioides gilvus TaxID=1735589 RepID=UPI000D74DF36|nr:hypothetical protein [Nocardioides gilvus]